MTTLAYVALGVIAFVLYIFTARIVYIWAWHSSNGNGKLSDALAVLGPFVLVMACVVGIVLLVIKIVHRPADWIGKGLSNLSKNLSTTIKFLKY
jgi:hypothetical protein